MLSYSEFGEMLRALCPARANDLLLDMYDEALQASSSGGDPAKYVAPEAA